MKRSPLRQKRPTPRRNEGRVKHNRIKPRAGDGPTPEERRHWDRLREMGCLVARQPVVDHLRCRGRVTIHHPTAPITGGRVARSHRRVTPLCERHHLITHDPHYSVEAMGHKGFFLVYGIDLLREADRLWEESVAVENLRRWRERKEGDGPDEERP